MTNLELTEPAPTSAESYQRADELGATVPVDHTTTDPQPKASPSSPDPLICTDRYRLVTPYLLKL